MSRQETVKLTVEMTFTTDNGEMPDNGEIEDLIAAQMAGELDEEIGLGCMVVEVRERTGDL